MQISWRGICLSLLRVTRIVELAGVTNLVSHPDLGAPILRRTPAEGVVKEISKNLFSLWSVFLSRRILFVLQRNTCLVKQKVVAGPSDLVGMGMARALGVLRSPCDVISMPFPGE
jgi:hypothetical protein